MRQPSPIRVPEHFLLRPINYNERCLKRPTRAGKNSQKVVKLCENSEPAFEQVRRARFVRRRPYETQTVAPNVALLLIRARYYDPMTGEFTSRDPLEYVDGMSLYRGYFVPNGTDPSGMDLASFPTDGGLPEQQLFTTTCNCRCTETETKMCGSPSRTTCSKFDVSHTTYAGMQRSCQTLCAARSNRQDNWSGTVRECSGSLVPDKAGNGFCALLVEQCYGLPTGEVEKCKRQAMMYCNCAKSARRKILSSGGPVYKNNKNDKDGLVCTECVNVFETTCGKLPFDYFYIKGQAALGGVHRPLDYVYTGGHQWNGVVFRSTGVVIATVDFWDDIDAWYGEGPDSCGHINNYP